ncbi:amino acid ABC transporter substrate-binding protein [Pseudoalteromonas luteoviolacea]|uniref:substrate-binding periplasmic protein n=1 Tax=Pseudoalteromonas luteoviolacea TaxID=43657 RepID=UPI001B3A147A|nr:transporter substrate-binding domain-containing protein [Pseudoalteromonas luteoviolacea]MBQ4880508.1 amino acid ABC transporter substrate-binding protein [Pseudoalteromonas luteoviolacea]MBQ4907270.1 amino acid ABC transporter substrate-binding protein [Pseudoalteromonas luteoviolacea]
MVLLLRALTVVYLSVGFACHAALKTVSVITLPDYAPFGFLDNGDTHVVRVAPGEDSPVFKGFAWDVVRESFHEMGYTVELWVVPWARALTYLDNGRVDLIFPVSISEERLKIYRYSKEYVNTVYYRIYVLKEQPIEWDSLATFDGKTIAQMRGFNYGAKWAQATDIKKYDVGEIFQGFEMLKSKRVHGFAGYEGVWDIVLQQHNLENEIVKLPMFDSNKEFIAASYGNPMAKKLLKQFDLGRQRITENGTMTRIKHKWSAVLSEQVEAPVQRN